MLRGREGRSLAEIMKAFLLLPTLLLLASCGSEPVPVAVAPSPVKPAAAPASAKPSAPSVPLVAGEKPSLKETQRLDRELGNSVIPYPFDNCAVIQRPFDREGPKHRRIYKGYEVLFCCTPCVRAFDANPEPYMPRIMAAANEKAAGLVTPPVVAQGPR